MGSCFSAPPQPSVKPQLFPDVYPDKDTQPAVYVLRPPEPDQRPRPGPSHVYRPARPLRPSVDAAAQMDAIRYSSDQNNYSTRPSNLKRAQTPVSTYPYNKSNVQPVDLESGRDAGAQAQANLAQVQANTAAAAAAQASAAAHAMSLQMGIISFQTLPAAQYNKDPQLDKAPSSMKKYPAGQAEDNNTSEGQDSSVPSLSEAAAVPRGASRIPHHAAAAKNSTQMDLTSSVSGASADSCPLETERQLTDHRFVEDEQLEVEYFGETIMGARL